MVEEIKRDETVKKEEPIKRDDNIMDDIVDLKTEDGESVGQSLMFVAVVRHLVRPFLIVFFCCLYAVIILTGLYLAYCGKLDIKEIFNLSMASVSNTIGIIIGYNFGKSATIDKK